MSAGFLANYRISQLTESPALADIVSMFSSNDTNRPQELDGRLKLISTALPVFAVVVYPIGLVLLNVVYTMWGFTDLQVLHVHSFFVVGWNCLLIFSASLLVFLCLSLRGSNARAKWPKWAKVVLLVVFLIVVLSGVGLWYWGAHHPEHARQFLADHVKTVAIFLIAAPGCITLIVPVGMVHDHKHPQDVPLYEWAAGALGVVGATIFFSITYFFVPASWGGGMPQPRTYFVPLRAIACLAPYNKSAQQTEAKLTKQPAGAAPEFIKVEGLSLVHEGADRIVLLSPPCKKLLRLPKEWFQNEAWDTPTPEAAPVSLPDCPVDDPAPGH